MAKQKTSTVLRTIKRHSQSALIVRLLSLLIICLGLVTAQAQQAQRPSVTITAAAAGDRVRVTAPSSVVQLHLEVYAASGEKVFDQELRGANVFDWHLQDGQAHRLPVGDYVSVVTAKSVSGRLSQKIGAVTVAENSASVRPLDSQQLSLPQTQAIGPVEENSSWTIATKDEPQTTTVIANDGTDGQMIRGRGALTFRIGNFFSGIDTEQMRLTEEGNLGIGTSEPKSKLDVAGTISAERFLIVKPNKTGGDKTASGAQATDGVDSVQPLIAGSGTQYQIAKWTDPAGTTLGDSGITETAAGNIGIGTTSPGRQLTLRQAGGAEMSWIDANSGQNWMWQENGSSYFRLYDLTNGKDVISFQPSTGYVGIGTTSPSRQLTLRQPGGAEMAWIDSTSGQNWMWQENGATSLRLFDVTHSKDVLAFLPSSGNVGIGTTSPAAKLDVAGDINTSTQYNLGGQTVLGMSSDNVLKLGNNTNVGIGPTFLPGYKLDVEAPDRYGLRVGTFTPGGTALSIGGFGSLEIDAPNIPGGRFAVQENGNVGIGINNPTSKLQVAGTVESTTGGFKFPDGTVQSTAANVGAGKAYTAKVLTELEIAHSNSSNEIINLTLPQGNYLITATVQFENRANDVFQDNTRTVKCWFIENSIAELMGTNHMGAPGNPMDFMSMTMHTTVAHFGNGAVSIRCGTSDSGGKLFAKDRRLTAVRLSDN